MGLFDRIQAKIELFRLEQRYTRRRNRRSTFVSNAIYVDGEYIYQSPATTGSSSASGSSTPGPAVVVPGPGHSPQSSPRGAEFPGREQKRLNRWSSMPGFGSTTTKEGGSMPSVREEGEWRPKRVSFHDERRY
ncbi:hypothetical protein C8A05DRAFT_42716 [Staphylotrichum tortipilum]|uniref:Uncharacterized protein n=1 Tax=Staphylotrichum tortipilum TaxID=2831512 RepID=A0AAN6MQI8_9PEZI|nr:hypothetical protein C8A05DRAFT_42716 [Staphylotrichum longicolle]